MPVAHTEYRIISDVDGYVSECSTRNAAEELAEQYNEESDLPNDHTVEEHTEYI